MERKLASIQVVRSLEPIPAADRIETAQILGWKCVVKKGEFVVGDAGVYFEVDSVLPDREWSAFLGEKKRLRTMKLRGQLSQGLLLPLNILPELKGRSVTQGEDVTLALSVMKYEPPQTGVDAEYAGPFPSYIPKTDEIRIQSEPGLLEEMRGLPWVATVKLDGTSATYLYDIEGEFLVCSRNRAVKQGENAYWQIARKHALAERLRGTTLAVQGELVGPGIQGNPLCLTEKRFFVFSLYDYQTGAFLSHAEMMAACEQWNLLPVPVHTTGAAFDAGLESLLLCAQSRYEGTSNEMEGLVIRPLEEKYSPLLNGRLSFKVLNNAFLLKEA